MMLSLKHSAKIKGIQPEILFALMVLQSLFDKYRHALVVTEVTGGKHMEGSLHYKGRAIDIRTNHIRDRSEKGSLIGEIRYALGDDFDVVFEAENAANEHLHIEYDPKEMLCESS